MKKRVIAIIIVSGISIFIIIFSAIFAIINRPYFNIVECTAYHECFAAYYPEYEKDTTKVISKRELQNVIEHCFDDSLKDSEKNSKSFYKYVFDKTVFVYHDKENGVFVANFGTYTIHKKSGCGYYHREQVVCINASNGEIISASSPWLSNDGNRLEVKLS